MKDETNNRGRGRPKGSQDSKKLKLKHDPGGAKLRYNSLYGDLAVVAIYGIDDYTRELLKSLWKDPAKEFVVTDPVEQYSANLTREVGALPYSMYRYKAISHVGFIESGRFPIVVVAKKYKEDVLKLPNPNKVEIICLEDL